MIYHYCQIDANKNFFSKIELASYNTATSLTSLLSKILLGSEISGSGRLLISAIVIIFLSSVPFTTFNKQTNEHIHMIWSSWENSQLELSTASGNRSWIFRRWNVYGIHSTDTFLSIWYINIHLYIFIRVGGVSKARKVGGISRECGWKSFFISLTLVFPTQVWRWLIMIIHGSVIEGRLPSLWGWEASV